jgi:hypothetical protein
MHYDQVKWLDDCPDGIIQYILNVIFPRKHGRIIMRHGAMRQENCGWSGARSGTRITTFVIHGEPTTRMSESLTVSQLPPSYAAVSREFLPKSRSDSR